MPVAPGRVRQLEAFLSQTVPKTIEDTNVVPMGVEAALGVKVQTAKSPSIKGMFAHGFMHNVMHLGYGETIPGTTNQLSSTVTHVGDKQLNEWELLPCWEYAGIDLPGPVMRLAELGSDAPMDLLAAAAADMMEVRKLERIRQLWGDGSGKLATIQAAASSGDVSLLVRRVDMTDPGYKYAHERGAKYFRPGRLFGVVNPATGARVGTAAHVVVSVDSQSSAGVDRVNFSPPLSADITPGMVLVPATYNALAYEREPNGFENIFDPGFVEPIHMGVDRRDCPEAGLYPELIFGTTGAEGDVTHFQVWTAGLLRRIHRAFSITTGEKKIDWVTRSGTKDELAYRSELRESEAGNNVPSELMSRANQGGGQGTAQFYDGVAKYSFMDEDVTVSFVVDNEGAPPNRALGIAPGYLERWNFDAFHALEGYSKALGGGAVQTSPTIDNWRKNYRGSSNLMSRRPFAAARIDNILHTDDVLPVR